MDGLFFVYVAKMLYFNLYSIFIVINIFILLLDKNAIQAEFGRFKAITAFCWTAGRLDGWTLYVLLYVNFDGRWTAGRLLKD